MRQRVFKMVVCIVLAVSVFLCSGGVAYADDSAEENDIDYWSGGFSVSGQPCMMLINANQNSLSDSTAYTATYSGSTNISVSMTPVTYGCTYEGAGYFDLYFTRSYSDATASYGRLNALCTDVSAPDGINLSFRSIDVTSDDRYGVRVYVYIDDYYVGTKGNVYFSFVLTINQGLTTTSGGSLMTAYYYMLDKYAYEYAGSIYEKVVNSNSEVGAAYDIGQQQMEQQQQIADQQAAQQESIAAAQASQSAQQHDDLINGYQDDSYNSQVSDAGDQIDAYIDQESALMADQQAQISDYAGENFNTGLINTYLPAVTAVGSWYTQIWNSFGQLNSAFVVILALGIASFLIGLKRR